MKHIYIAIFSTLLLLSCSSDEDTDSILVNYPINIDLFPSLPSLIYPTNNLICTNFELEFQWEASEAFNRNTLTYIIEIAQDETFENILFTANTAQTSSTFNLEKGTTYFWRVKARDNKGYESRFSALQTFFTEPEAGINAIPHSPEVVAPTLGATVSGSQTTLDWNATDSDGDPLVFDVYFGESNPPQLVAENIDVSTFDVTTSANTTYYWRVVAKDNNQGVAIGRVWNFRTQ